MSPQDLLDLLVRKHAGHDHDEEWLEEGLPIRVIPQRPRPDQDALRAGPWARCQRDGSTCAACLEPVARGALLIKLSVGWSCETCAAGWQRTRDAADRKARGGS